MFENAKWLSVSLITLSMLLIGTSAVQGLDIIRHAPSEVSSDEEFEVTLTIDGNLPLIFGINETIPTGFTFVSTTCDYYSVSGQTVAFAGINVTEIKYRVKAPSSGEGTFSGNWVDMLNENENENEGSIADSHILVTQPNPSSTGNIKGVTRHAPSEVSSDEEFEVTLTIDGNLPLIFGINETIPTGFTFVSTTCDYYSVSGQTVAFAGINVTEIKYRVKAPSSGEGTFSGNWVDMLNENEGSIAESVDITVKVKTGSTTSSSKGGGGSGGSTDNERHTNLPDPKAPSEYYESFLEYFHANETKVISLTSELEDKTSIIEIGALENEDVGMVLITVSKTSSLPETVTEPEGNASIFFEITFVEYDTLTEIEPSGYIKYKLSKEWLTNNGAKPSDVLFLKWDGEKWIELPSEVTGEDDNYYYFKINLESFCIFAVIAEAVNTDTTSISESTSTTKVTPEETLGKPTPILEEKSTTTTTITTTPSEKVTSELGTQTHIDTSIQKKQSQFLQPTVTIAIAAVVLCFIGVLAYFGLRKGGEKE